MGAIDKEMLSATLSKISSKSVENYYNPYTRFDWPADIPADTYWMSRELMSIHETPLADWLSESQKIALSKWESVNFYSLNVNGIKELLTEVINRIHTDRFKHASPYLHHMIGEENMHMWFFAKFCDDYAGKIYAEQKFNLGGAKDTTIEDFLVFCRIVIFEEIVDFYNIHMGDDKSLPQIVQDINRVHHEDESRHVAFGRNMVTFLYEGLKQHCNQQQLFETEVYLKRYMLKSIESFYQAEVYANAGIPDSEHFREMLLKHPGRRPHHEKMIKRTFNFFVNAGIFSNGDIVDTLDGKFRPADERPIDAVKRYLIEANPNKDLKEIASDLDIIETRVLDSLKLMAFLVFLEGLRGQKIEADQVDLNNLRTLATIERHFLSPRTQA